MNFVRQIVQFVALLAGAFTFLCGYAVVAFWAFLRPPKPWRNLRPVVLMLASADMPAHLANNSRGLIEHVFERPNTRYTMVLHVGDCAPAVTRATHRVIGVDIRLPTLARHRWTPRFFRMIVREAWGLISTYKIARRLRPVAIEAWSPSALVPRATLLRWLLPVKLVTQVRGNVDVIAYHSGVPVYLPFRVATGTGIVIGTMFDKLVSLLFFRACDLVQGLSVNTLESAVSNGAHPAKARLFRIAVEPGIADLPILPRRDLEGFPAEGRVVTLWSRLAADKLVRESLEGIQLLLSTHPDVGFVMIGDGPLQPELTEWTAVRGLARNVHFVGRRDQKYIRSAAHYSNVVLVPLGGSSLVEAALFARPIVAFAIEWHHELIRPGETGYLADYPDAVDLARQLAEALDNRDEAERRAGACARLARVMFDPAIAKAEEKRIWHSFMP
ncbi:MAG TPA: glycosyltransferase [Stellaceae bacterium]|nr:glycosyltransferase [Stellaceae bacterium]